jgi:hypothetical protein
MPNTDSDKGHLLICKVPRRQPERLHGHAGGYAVLSRPIKETKESEDMAELLPLMSAQSENQNEPSKRELEILALLTDGKCSSTEIASLFRGQCDDD